LGQKIHQLKEFKNKIIILITVISSVGKWEISVEKLQLLASSCSMTFSAKTWHVPVKVGVTSL